MIREHWREPRFWLWWFRRGGPPEVRVLAGLLVLAAVLGGGFLAAVRLADARAGVTPTSRFAFATTVTRNVTVRENGRVVVRRVPVVRRVIVRPQTVLETRFRTERVAAPGGVRVVTHAVAHYVPVVKRHTVTVAGQEVVRRQTVLVPTTKTETQTQTQVQTQTRTQTRTQVQTVTNAQTVVDRETSTVVATVPVTTTVRRPVTVVSTETQPPDTVTETRTVTDSVTVTQPAVTVTAPAVTITVRAH